MSGLINKVKEAVHSDKKDNAATDNPQSSNAGPYKSNLANKADPRVDSDRDNYGTPGGPGGAGYGSGPTHGQHGHTGGYQDPNVGTGPGGSYGHGGPGNPQSSNAGPHSSNVANKADPRVDSDLDGGRNLGGAGHTGGAGYGAQHSGVGGVGHSNTGVGGGYGGPGNPQSSNAGPHSSNLANRADPRVDSDLDGGRNLGGGAGYGGQHSGAHTGAGVGGGYGGPGNPQSSNAGPHGSNFANKADPRVDSDLDGGRNAGFGTSGAGHTSHTGYDQGATGGPGAGGYGSSATPGSGDANKTAGPHNSNLLNKLDPRVDSDMDGSKTYGGNQTHR